MKILNKGNSTEILIYEDIGEGWFGGVSARALVAALKDAKHNVLVRLNSPGGDVFEGLAMYNALVNSGKNITTQVDGLAASAASVVFMAAETRKMAENSLIMIHNAWTMIAGNAKDLRDRAEALDAISGNLAKIYADGTGKSRKDVTDWMDAETWFSVEAGEKLEGGSVVRSAIDDGFATEIIENLRVAAKFDPKVHRFERLPRALRAPPRAKLINMRIERVKNYCLDIKSR